MLQRSSISTTPKIAILPYALSIFPFLCVSELHGALSGHIFEETAETIDIIEAERLVYFAYAHISGEHCTCLFKAHRIQVFDHRYAELLFKLCLEAVFIYVKSPGEMV